MRPAMGCVAPAAHLVGLSQAPQPAPLEQPRRKSDAAQAFSTASMYYAEICLGGLKTPWVTPVGAADEMAVRTSPDGTAAGRVSIRVGIKEEPTVALQQLQCWQLSSQSPWGVSPGHSDSHGSWALVVGAMSPAGVAAFADEFAASVIPKESTIVTTPSRCVRLILIFGLSSDIVTNAKVGDFTDGWKRYQNPEGRAIRLSGVCRAVA